MNIDPFGSRYLLGFKLFSGKIANAKLNGLIAHLYPRNRHIAHNGIGKNADVFVILLLYIYNNHTREQGVAVQKYLAEAVVIVANARIGVNKAVLARCRGVAGSSYYPDRRKLDAINAFFDNKFLCIRFLLGYPIYINAVYIGRSHKRRNVRG